MTWDKELDELRAKEEQYKQRTKIHNQLCDAMSVVLQDYCKVNNLEHTCYDHILNSYPNLTDDQKAWLKAYGQMWDKLGEFYEVEF